MNAVADDNLPADAGPMIRDTIAVEGRAFALLRPEKPERLLDDPAVIAAFERDEYLPYWAELWPSAVMLAAEVLGREFPAGMKVLEIGCGLGLAGLAALTKGLQVTFSDYEPRALQLAAANARLNGFRHFQVMLLDWRCPPDLRFPLILAADVLYEERNAKPVFDLLRQMLLPDGLCLLADQDRKPAELFRSMLATSRWAFETKPVSVRVGNKHSAGSIYQVRYLSAQSSDGLHCLDDVLL